MHERNIDALKKEPPVPVLPAAPPKPESVPPVASAPKPPPVSKPGPSLEQITVEVGSGIRSAKDGAALYDEDVKKQAQQLGLPGW